MSTIKKNGWIEIRTSEPFTQHPKFNTEKTEQYYIALVGANGEDELTSELYTARTTAMVAAHRLNGKFNIERPIFLEGADKPVKTI